MPEYVTVQEYAQIKGVHERTVYRWVKNNDVDVKEIDGKTHVKLDGQGNGEIDKDARIASLMSENQHLNADVEYLKTQLAQALTTIDTMQEDRQRSDTIVLSLTQQVEQLTGQNQLLLEDSRQKKGFLRRLFAWNGT